MEEIVEKLIIKVCVDCQINKNFNHEIMRLKLFLNDLIIINDVDKIMTTQSYYLVSEYFEFNKDYINQLLELSNKLK